MSNGFQPEAGVKCVIVRLDMSYPDEQAQKELGTGSSEATVALRIGRAENDRHMACWPWDVLARCHDVGHRTEFW